MSKRKPKPGVWNSKPAKAIAKAPDLPIYQPVPEVVKLAESIMSDCQNGRMVGLSISWVTQAGTTGSASAFPNADATRANLLGMAIAKHNHSFTAALVDGDRAAIRNAANQPA